MKCIQNISNKIITILILILFLIFPLSHVKNALASFKIKKVRHSVKPLDLTHTPTTEELMAAGQLGGQLYPTSDISIEDIKISEDGKASKVSAAMDSKNNKRNKDINLSFGQAIDEWNKHNYNRAVKMFKAHVQEYPDSPWADEAVLHVGCDARYNGRYTEAEESFDWIINRNKGKEHLGAKMLLNKARSRLAILKMLQGNFRESMDHFRDLKKESPDWRHRTYAAHWIQRLSRYKKDELALLSCGTQALAYVMKKEGRESEAGEVLEMKPVSLQGHSIKELMTIASKYSYDLTGLKMSVNDLDKITLPAIVQINKKHKGDRGHYWILEKSDHGLLEFFDPQSGRRFHQSDEAFAKEWAGNILVFSHYKNKEMPGILLSESEISKTYGACCGVPRPESDLGNPGGDGLSGTSNNPNPCGAPAWSVNMVNMNLFVTDTPLWYSSPIGPSVKVSLSYNSQSAIANNEPFGNKWLFNYGSYLVIDTGGTVTVFMPDGRRDVYVPDGTGGYVHPFNVYNELIKLAENHFELRFPDDTIYIYNIPSGTTSLQPFLVEVRDAYSQTLTLGYDTNVQLATITDALGRVTALTYNTDGLVTQVADPFGRTAAFEYDADRNLTRITDMGGYWSGLSYDQDVYLTGIENDRGKWEFFIEPADGLPNDSDGYPPPGGLMWENYRITMTNPLGGKEEYYYLGYSGYGWYVNPRDYLDYTDYNHNNYRSNVPMTSYYFTSNSSGHKDKISKIVYPGGGSESYLYDSNGNRIKITDSHGHNINYTYNFKGSATSRTDAKGVTTNMTYDSNGVDLLQVQDGLGTVTNIYNGTHDITSTTDRLDNTTSVTYNTYGQKTSLTDALGIITNYIYDAGHNLEQVTRDGQVLENFTYDTIGRIKTHTDASGLTMSYDYNDLNNVTRKTYPDGKYMSYTYSGCCPHLIDNETDRAGRTTSYTYDALKRLTESVNSEGGVTKNVYDANGNRVKLIDPNGNVTSFEYDLDNRLVKKVYADGRDTSFSYDSDGLMISRVDSRGITTNYSYDQKHNLLNTGYSDGTPSVINQYDNYNRLTQREDGAGVFQFTYDANSRMTGMDGPWVDDTLIYQYDDLDRRVSTAVQGGETLVNTYDALSRLTNIQVGTDSYSYAYNGASPLIQSLDRPNGSFTSYQYDNLNRLTEISNKNSSSVIFNQYTYVYNQHDMRSNETITNGNPITSLQNDLKTYDYNKVNQLLNSTNPAKTFIHDNDGNMTGGYTPDGYAFTSAYDAENRLKSVEYTDGGVVRKTEYIYSGDSFIAQEKKYENGALVTETRFVRDGFLPLQERDGSNALVREYAWGLNMGGGIGGLLQLKQGGQNYSYLYDGKGNVTALIDSTQSVTTAYTYDAFGNLMVKTGTVEQPFQFSTKRYDENTGLSYYGYRFYSPSLGRWIMRDPIGETGGGNLYDFVNNNALNLIDSYGLEKKDSSRRDDPFSPTGYTDKPLVERYVEALKHLEKNPNDPWAVEEVRYWHKQAEVPLWKFGEAEGKLGKEFAGSFTPPSFTEGVIADLIRRINEWWIEWRIKKVCP